MSTIFVALAIVGLSALAVALFITIENRKKKQQLNRFLSRFTDLGASNNMKFSSHEIFDNVALGFDGLHRCLLVLSVDPDNLFEHHLLSLDDVKSCSVKKEYGNMQDGMTDQYLERIILRFEFKRGNQPVDVAFYEHMTNNIYQVRELEEKASHWKTFFSKMLNEPVKVTEERSFGPELARGVQYVNVPKYRPAS